MTTLDEHMLLVVVENTRHGSKQKKRDHLPLSALVSRIHNPSLIVSHAEDKLLEKEEVYFNHSKCLTAHIPPFVVTIADN